MRLLSILFLVVASFASAQTIPANYVYASPNGSSGSPRYRPLVSADIPSLSYVPLTRSISTTSPLTGGGVLSSDLTIAIANALADGSTKGAASFIAADFNSSSGVISIDYTNGQSASASTKGFLTLSDWALFNAKQEALVSGTTIKTVGGNSLLGSGNVTEVTQTITNGITITTPSEDAVFDALVLKAALASPTFTGTVTIPTPFTLGATSVTSTGTQLNYLNSATGTTGTASSNVVFSASPALTGTPTAPTATAGTNNTQLATTYYADNSVQVDSLGAMGKAVIVPGSTIYSFGSSITAGTPGPTGAAYRYPNIINNHLGTTVNNQGVGATGSYAAVKAAFAVTTLRLFPTTIEFGLNDMRASPASGAGNTPSYEKVKGGIRAFLANQFLSSSVVPANSGSVTQGGTWTTVTSGTIGEKASNISGLALQSSVNGSTLTYTSSGSTLVVGTFGVYEASQPGGTFTVTVDGVLKATFNNRNLTDGVTDGVANQNNITQNAVVITGLPTGSHTVVITITSLSASGKVYIDYIGTLNNPQNCLPVVVLSVPKMDATGYATGAAGANDAVLNTMDAHAKSVIREFRGFPVYFAFTNLNFNSTTDLHTDHIHRNDLGNSKMAKAVLQAIHPINPSKATQFTSNNGGTFNNYFGQNGSTAYMAANRNPLTGVFDNTSLSGGVYQQVAASADFSHEWYTSTGNNATPIRTLILDKNGVLTSLENVASPTQASYFRASTNVVEWWANRNPQTGTFFNTGKAGAAIQLIASSGQGEIWMYSSPTNNTTPLQRVTLDKDGFFILGRNSVAAGTLRFLEDTDNGSNYSEITVGAQAGNITYTLPTAAPTVSGQSLTSTTAGVMSWAAAGIDATAGDAATVNTLAGRFRKDTSGSTFTLTNSFITANSIITWGIGTTGITTGYDIAVVPGSGSAVFTFQTAGVAAAPSANCDVNFFVQN